MFLFQMAQKQQQVLQEEKAALPAGKIKISPDHDLARLSKKFLEPNNFVPLLGPGSSEKDVKSIGQQTFLFENIFTAVQKKVAENRSPEKKPVYDAASKAFKEAVKTMELSGESPFLYLMASGKPLVDYDKKTDQYRIYVDACARDKAGKEIFYEVSFKPTSTKIEITGIKEFKQ